MRHTRRHAYVRQMPDTSAMTTVNARDLARKTADVLDEVSSRASNSGGPQRPTGRGTGGH
jgi:hypothetical protein